DRVTDHRVKLTESGVERILNGELDDFTEALASEEKRRRLEAQTAETTRAPASTPSCFWRRQPAGTAPNSQRSPTCGCRSARHAGSRRRSAAASGASPWPTSWAARDSGESS